MDVLIRVELIVALALAGAHVVFVRRRSPSFAPARALAALALGAFALRVLLPPHTLYHEELQGWTYLRQVLAGDIDFRGAPSTVFLALSWLAPLFGGGHEGVFLANATLSALSVPAVGALAFHLGGGRTAAWLAAVLWALTPVSIAIAPTESMFNTQALLLPLATVVVLKGMAARSRLLLALAAVLIALEAQCRFMSLAHPATVAFLVAGRLAAGPWNGAGWRDWLWPIAPFAGAALLLAPWMAVRLTEGSYFSDPLQWPFFLANWEAFTATLTETAVISPALWLLVLAGVAAFVRRARPGRRFAAAALLVGSFVFVVGPPAAASGLTTALTRFFLPTTALLTTLAGLGGALLVEGGRRVAGRPAARATGAAVALSPLLALPFVWAPRLDGFEYRVLADDVSAVLRAAPAGRVTAVLHGCCGATFASVEATTWLLQRTPGWEAWPEDGRVPDGPAYVYLGYACNLAWDERGGVAIAAGAPAVAPACAERLAGREWELVRKWPFPADTIRQSTPLLPGTNALLLLRAR